ncbi:MAG: hypothetical protein LBO07_03405 [Coriobacteriales bacterium]|jgi:hypothetical protein|nr:hypothetical protein [Coriobacteriales bacterium]
MATKTGPKQAAPTKKADGQQAALPKKTDTQQAALPKKTGARPERAAEKSVSRQIVFDPTEDRTTIANQAASDPAILAALAENLSIDARRVRQFSAAALNVLSERQPQLLVPFIAQLADALHRPEAQTRWESLEALCRLAPLDPAACDAALSGAEISLYDEESGPTRLAALRFLTVYGALDARRSTKVWPLIDEALQCYHGDAEFQDMLVCVIAFAGGRTSKDVRRALAARMDFDAKHNKGVLRKRAAQIIEICER